VQSQPRCLQRGVDANIAADAIDSRYSAMQAFHAHALLTPACRYRSCYCRQRDAQYARTILFDIIRADSAYFPMITPRCRHRHFISTEACEAREDTPCHCKHTWSEKRADERNEMHQRAFLWLSRLFHAASKQEHACLLLRSLQQRSAMLLQVPAMPTASCSITFISKKRPHHCHSSLLTCRPLPAPVMRLPTGLGI